MKKLLSLLMLLVAIVTGAKAADIVWDFSDLSAKDFTNGSSYSFKATDGTTEMRYSAGSSDKIVAKDGSTSGYLKENGKTGGATVKDIDGVTNVGKTRLIRLFVTGKGKLTINCNGTNGTYKVLDGSASGTTLISSLSANEQSDAITVSSSLLWIETTTKGYITSIVWSPVSATEPSISAADTEITAVESGVEVSEEITITGENLTGSTLTATLSNDAPSTMNVILDNNTISGGAISATATITYSATENASGTATLTLSDGTTSKEVAIKYVSTVNVATQTDVTGAETWDIENDITSDADAHANGKYELYANIAGLTLASTFDGTSLLVNATSSNTAYRKQYKCAQGAKLKFHTTVAGYVRVTFQSPSDETRNVIINGTTCEGSDGTRVVTDYHAVEAGDVELTYTKSIRFFKVEFVTEKPATTETITIPSDGVLTYVTENALDLTSVDFTAYVPTGVNEAKTKVNTAEVTSVPAGTALLIKGDAGEYNVNIVASAEEPEANIFSVSDGTVTGGDNIFAYSKSALKFKKVASTVTIPAGKCYLQIDGVSGDALDLDFEGEATAVEAIAEANAEAAAPVKVIKNGKLYIGNYNVAGQQVK